MNKKIKIKKYLFFAFLIIFLLCAAHFVFASEVVYPQIPGLPNDLNNVPPSPPPSLGDYISYFFGFLVYVAGILSLISFTIGAVFLISPDPSMHGEAKDRMKGSIFGLLLSVAAFVILSTINPVFITPSLTPLPGVQGVYYWNGTNEKPVGISESDVQHRSAELQGYNSIKYDCTEGATGQPALLIWEFPNAGLDAGNSNNLSNVKVVRINCGDDTSIGNLGSFSMAFETPGVYYCYGGCSGTMCDGYMSQATTASQNTIPSPFAGEISGVRIVNTDNGSNYGVIFHNTQGLTNAGGCTTPIIAGEDSDCFPVSNIDTTAAADIFVVDKSNNSGRGVNFYSKPTGWDQYNGSLEAGFYPVTKDDIYSAVQSDGYYSIEMSKMCFSYQDVSVPEAYKHKCSNSTCGGQDYSCKSDSDCSEGQTCDTANDVCVDGQSEEDICSDSACETFQDCPGSIQSNGNYLIGLYSIANSDNSGSSTSGSNNGYTWCQTFTDTVPNLDVQGIVAAGTEMEATKQKPTVYIIPIQ